MREGEGSNSRYAEPEADGTKPVFRSVVVLAFVLDILEFRHTDFPEFILLALAVDSLGDCASFQMGCEDWWPGSL